MFSMCVFQGATVNGFVNIGISTLEKRFGFESWMTGLMAVSYVKGSSILFINFRSENYFNPFFVIILLMIVEPFILRQISGFISIKFSTLVLT